MMNLPNKQSLGNLLIQMIEALSLVELQQPILSPLCLCSEVSLVLLAFSLEVHQQTQKMNRFVGHHQMSLYSFLNKHFHLD